jgi:ACS family hexuronate transporter-like MFS transporter
MAAFQLSYAFFQWPAGYMADRWNLRRTYAVAVTWWSAAGIATAFAPNLALLMTFRSLLGVGESFNWPCALRVTSGVLPPSDRSLGNGIFNSGAAMGAVLTPLLVTPLAVGMGWRWAFVALGVAGLVWVVSWMILTAKRDLAGFIPARDRHADSGLFPQATLAFAAVPVVAIATTFSGWLLLSNTWRGAAVWWGVAVLMMGLLAACLLMPREWLAGADWASSLGEIVRLRRFWIVASVGITINVTWHFLVNWTAIFFQEGRSLGMLLGGMVSALPFLAADVGNLGGGILIRLLTRRGLTPSAARKLVMTISLLLVSCAIWVGFVESEVLIVALLCLAAMGSAAYIVNFFAFGQDVAPEHTGLVNGYLGGLGNLFAAGFMPIAGWISQGRYGFAPNFIIIGLLPLAGLATLLVFWRADKEK